MTNSVGILDLATAVAGVYESVWLTLTGLYGVPFSLWYVVVFVGAATLLTSAVFQWVSTRPWTQWLPIVGTLLLASYFLPGGLATLQSYLRSDVAGGSQLATRLAVVALVLASLATAIVNRIGHGATHSPR